MKMNRRTIAFGLAGMLEISIGGCDSITMKDPDQLFGASLNVLGHNPPNEDASLRARNAAISLGGITSSYSNAKAGRSGVNQTVNITPQNSQGNLPNRQTHASLRRPRNVLFACTGVEDRNGDGVISYRDNEFIGIGGAFPSNSEILFYGLVDEDGPFELTTELWYEGRFLDDETREVSPTGRHVLGGKISANYGLSEGDYSCKWFVNDELWGEAEFEISNKVTYDFQITGKD